MTTPERLRDIADALARHARAGEVLHAPDVLALAAALNAEADTITASHRARTLRAWEVRRAA